MNKTIFCLIAFGIALSLLHVPSVIIPVGIIACLSILTVKVFWSVLQSFSQSTVKSQTGF
ncbi:MAG: hypothetical protein AAFR58_11540 [Cyanobacteria bacterium J06627_28]